MPLTGRPFDMLVFLLEHPNELIEKQVLMRAVWPNAIVEENNLNQNILLVRRALGETPGEHRFVVTVPGRGFRFVSFVSRNYVSVAPAPESDATEVSAVGTLDPGRLQSPGPDSDVTFQSTPRHLQSAAVTLRAWPWIVGAFAAALIVAAYFALRPNGKSSVDLSKHHAAGASAAPGSMAVSEPSPAPPVQVSAGVPPKDSVAVLPFANLTGDVAKDYFSDGMAEELIDALAHVPNLMVPARTSSFAYRNRNADIRAIARDLGVANILEGSVRGAGDRILVTVQLVDARTGYNVFSQSYNRRFDDIFKLQHEVATSIVTALRGSLTAGPAQPLESPPTQDVEAYHLYLQAAPTSLQGSQDAFRHAVSLLDQAISRDPNFTRAWSARAMMRSSFVVFGYPEPHVLEDSERDARKALMLDPNDATAYGALGGIDAMRGNWISADVDFHAAIEAAPREPLFRNNYHYYVSEQTGLLRRARADANAASRLAPADSFTAMLAPVADYLQGHDNEAVKGADFAVGLGLPPRLPPLPLLYAFAASRNGHYSEAVNHAAVSLTSKGVPLDDVATLQVVYAAVADPSKRPAGRAALQKLVRKYGVAAIDPGSRTFLANLFTMVDDLDDAYDVANRSLDLFGRSGLVGATWSGLWIPEMRPFRQDARFQRFAARLKMFDYWRQYGPPDGCELKGKLLVCH